MTHIGILGAGNIGSNVARAAVAAGHTVTISNSRGPESLADLIAELGPGAAAGTTHEAATAGELVLVAIPLGRIGEIDDAPLEGKIVMDANNYYPQRDGRIAALDRNESTTSELLQARHPGAHVVKTFNNIVAAEIPTDGTPPGTLVRRALPIAGNDADAKVAVTDFLDSLGYDAVDMGPLSESWRSERDTSAYGVRTNADELRELLATTARTVQE
ncbi:MAG: NADP oxidoreductase [Actinobacteria bacterium HGW-Actinobacteria-4]|nr:MAG: NADP oxidoreductase [Actinobacteria bacterium HGW-Actinobacteria-4]